MAGSDFPAPQSGFVVTHFLVVSDQDRSRDFYRSVFGATVVMERDPVILKIASSWLILNAGGGPAESKPARLQRGRVHRRTSASRRPNRLARRVRA